MDLHIYIHVLKWDKCPFFSTLHLSLNILVWDLQNWLWATLQNLTPTFWKGVYTVQRRPNSVLYFNNKLQLKDIDIYHFRTTHDEFDILVYIALKGFSCVGNSTSWQTGEIFSPSPPVPLRATPPKTNKS